MRRLGCGLLLAGLAGVIARGAGAADRNQVKFSRYLRTEFCMERALGQRWLERVGVAMAINRWGASEPRF
jgi:hypothetical protein